MGASPTGMLGSWSQQTQGSMTNCAVFFQLRKKQVSFWVSFKFRLPFLLVIYNTHGCELSLWWWKSTVVTNTEGVAQLWVCGAQRLGQCNFFVYFFCQFKNGVILLTADPSTALSARIPKAIFISQFKYHRGVPYLSNNSSRCVKLAVAMVWVNSKIIFEAAALSFNIYLKPIPFLPQQF